MIFIGSLLFICFPLGNGRSLTEKRQLPLKETIVPTPGNGSFQGRKLMETLSIHIQSNSHITFMSIGDMKRD